MGEPIVNQSDDSVASISKRLDILYRGPLSSCNYGCPYCPFAKHHETAAELKVDRACLEKFSDWIAGHSGRRYGILFTPWGEALTRRWYREAMILLSRQPHVARVAVQTNLSCPLDWMQEADRRAFALWCTYHPGEVSRSDFISQCNRLCEMGIRFSVGIVGLKEHAIEIKAMRDALPADVYLWINAYKREPNYYDQDLIEAFAQIDKLFPINNQYHQSLGKPCRTGERVISVDGDGTIRRCHFVKERIGNLYDDDLTEILKPRDCTNATCGCHIGYVHMPELKLDQTFGESILERIVEKRS